MPNSKTPSWTVLLLYPDWAADQYGEDTYTAHVSEATSPQIAVNLARREVFDRLSPDERRGHSPADFAALGVFEGTHVNRVDRFM